MREGRFRAHLMEALRQTVPGGGTVLDVGAGTGTFAIGLSRARPDLRVTAIDGDPEVLAVARRKDRGGRVDWRAGLAGALPVSGGEADAVVMSLLLHHLDAVGKVAALAEARRVLRPGGRLHIADWGRPRDPLMFAAFVVLRSLDGFANTREHAAGQLPALVRAAGFPGVTMTLRLRTGWGSLEVLEAGAGDPGAR